IRLDPCSSGLHWVFGVVHWVSRQPELAIAEYEQSLELEPNFPQAHWGLGQALLAQRKDDAAIAQFQKAHELTRHAPVTAHALAEAYAVAGESEKSRDILNRLQEITGQT